LYINEKKGGGEGKGRVHVFSIIGGGDYIQSFLRRQAGSRQQAARQQQSRAGGWAGLFAGLCPSKPGSWEKEQIFCASAAGCSCCCLIIHLFHNITTVIQEKKKETNHQKIIKKICHVSFFGNLLRSFPSITLRPYHISVRPHFSPGARRHTFFSTQRVLLF
jgi:hypothetical protein